MLIGWLPSLAHDFEVEGVFYKKISDNAVAVTYKGYSHDSYSNEYAGDVVIPSSVNYNGTTYSVTSIGDDAFNRCSSLTSIKIPNSVTSIGQGAFVYCSSLTSVEIGNSVTSIGDYAFYYCSSLTSVIIGNSVTSIGVYAFVYCSSLTSIQIPNSVTSIGDYAFSNCSSLTSIQIPNSVTSIGEGAFYYCKSLTSVEIGNSVTSIGDYAFSNCSSLTSVIIGNSVTSIGYGAFVYCSSLTSIQIPNSVTSIGEWALGYCSSLTSIEIGNSVTSIGNNAFAYCESLTNIVVDYDNAVYESRNGCNAIIETASNTLIAGCKNTIIPNGVTSIGDIAFNGCSSLTSIQIPNSVTSIGDYAFSNCSSLTGIEIPNSVTSIGDRAFYGCSSLTKITCLATNPPTIKSYTFSKYSAELYVPAGCKSAYQSANHWKKFYNIKEIPTLSTSIALNQTTATLEVTETITLIATILPENATDKSVEWSSSDETVAVVDENGVVTAISIGEAVITATTADGSNLSASCKVTVAPTLAVSIELDQTEASVEEKSDLQLIATILPEHTTNKEVAWSSSDKWVASVDNYGLVTMYSAGEVIITAATTDGTNLSATCRINVYSGIDGVNGDDVIVATVGDNIVVKNAKLGNVVNVYASNGALIASEEATDGSVVVEAPVKGVYVVKVGKQTVKVII